MTYADTGTIMPLVRPYNCLRAGELMSASVRRRRSGLRSGITKAAGRAPWLVDVYRAARHPTWARDLRRDLVELRHSASFLAEASGSITDTPPVLVGLYRDNVYDAKLGCTLAAALRLRGRRPIVSIPSKRAHRLRAYGRAFGIDDFVLQDAVKMAPADEDECATTIEQYAAGPLDFAAIAGWEFRGYDIGTHVLSTLIRVTFDGSPDLAVKENASLLRAVLTDVVENVVRSERLIDELLPRTLLVDEANYSVNGPLVDVALARGVDVIQTVPTWRDNALVSKRLTLATRRVDAHSVSDETLARVEHGAWGSRQEAELDADFAARYSGTWALGRQYQPGTVSRTGEQIRAELALDARKPTCVVFAHVLWDATLFFGEDLFENYAHWLVTTVAAATANRNVNWIVKAHPSNVYTTKRGFSTPQSSELTLLRRNFTSLPDHVRILPAETTISTLSLYEFADAGVTVRGTPGMEIACFGKAAITAGTGAYSNRGFTYDSGTREEYLSRLSSIQHYGRISHEVQTLARRYVHALFVRRPWQTGSFHIRRDTGSEERWHPLDPNLVLNARTTTEFEDLGDLGEWADWVVDDSELDFVPKARW
jgi:hypothetical protein